MNSLLTTASTNATSVNIASDDGLRDAEVNASISTSAASATPTGTRNARQRVDAVTRRQASTGPIPASSTSTSARGVVRLLNHGGPTLSFWPVMASEMSGKKVPQKIT